MVASESGGERGIRTPGGLRLNGFQDRRNRPLCHLSVQKMMRTIKGISPRAGKGKEVFASSGADLLSILPLLILGRRLGEGRGGLYFE